MSGEIVPEDVGAVCITRTEAERLEIERAPRYDPGVVVTIDLNEGVTCVKPRTPINPAILRVVIGSTYRGLAVDERKLLPRFSATPICCEPIGCTAVVGADPESELWPDPETEAEPNPELLVWGAAREFRRPAANIVWVATIPSGPHAVKDQEPVVATPVSIHQPTLVQMVEDGKTYPTYKGELSVTKERGDRSGGRLAVVLEHVQQHPHRGPKGRKIQCSWGLMINAALSSSTEVAA